jgi:hypothetical protein
MVDNRTLYDVTDEVGTPAGKDSTEEIAILIPIVLSPDEVALVEHARSIDGAIGRDFTANY